MKSSYSLLVAGVVASGCAQTPPARISFPLTQTMTDVMVTRTVKCDRLFTPYVTSTVTIDVNHGPDPDDMGTLDMSRLDSPLAHTSLDLHFLPDQRLSSINVESDGQGEEILKAAIGLATTVFPFSESGKDAHSAATPALAEIESACRLLMKRMGDQAMSVSYVTSLDFADSEASLPLNPIPDDTERARIFAALLGSMCATYRSATPSVAPIVADPRASRLTMLDARQPGLVALSIVATPGATACEDLSSASSILWAGSVPVGQLGTRYTIPVPRAAAFGKQVFAVTFDDSGALGQLKYGKQTGAGQAIGVGQAAADAVKRPSDSDRTAAIEAEIALRRAQSQRVKCLADATQC